MAEVLKGSYSQNKEFVDNLAREGFFTKEEFDEINGWGEKKTWIMLKIF